MQTERHRSGRLASDTGIPPHYGMLALIFWCVLFALFYPNPQVNERTNDRGHPTPNSIVSRMFFSLIKKRLPACVRLIQAGEYGAAIKLDRQIPSTTGWCLVRDSEKS
jgi:hypothetical protein